MSGLKRGLPELRFSASNPGAQNNTPLYAVTPDEIDRYETETIDIAGAGGAAYGTTAVAGTSAAQAVVLVSAIPDWPRSVEFAVTGTGAGMAGTLTLNGFDQFGSVIQEVIAVATAANGGTTSGTKVFGQFTSGTVNFGTAVGNGTTRIGPGTVGTTSVIGLPYKLGGTTDVKLISWIVGTGLVPINGGTIAAFVNVPMHGINLPFNAPVGTATLNVWARPTYNAENLGLVANLKQRT